jgi:hypothetical protein
LGGCGSHKYQRRMDPFAVLDNRVLVLVAHSKVTIQQK